MYYGSHAHHLVSSAIISTFRQVFHSCCVPDLRIGDGLELRGGEGRRLSITLETRFQRDYNFGSFIFRMQKKVALYKYELKLERMERKRSVHHSSVSVIRLYLSFLKKCTWNYYYFL